MLTKIEKLEIATQQGMTLEEYEEQLQAASAKVETNLEQYPDAGMSVSEDVFTFMELDMQGQEINPEAMAELDGDLSCLDAELHEEEEA